LSIHAKSPPSVSACISLKRPFQSNRYPTTIPSFYSHKDFEFDIRQRIEERRPRIAEAQREIKAYEFTEEAIYAPAPVVAPPAATVPPPAEAVVTQADDAPANSGSGSDQGRKLS
jgi:hypothetical protein